MKKHKIVLMVVLVVLASLIIAGCAAGKKEGVKEVSIKEVSVIGVVQTDRQAAVTVEVALLNPVADVGPDITFEVSFDTHSVDMSSYDILGNVSLSSESGVVLTGKNFIWQPEAEDSHHRSGLLIVPAQQVVLEPELGQLTLKLTDLAGVEVREFVWEKELLKKFKE